MGNQFSLFQGCTSKKKSTENVNAPTEGIQGKLLQITFLFL